jgi:hypothetical protein
MGGFYYEWRLEVAIDAITMGTSSRRRPGPCNAVVIFEEYLVESSVKLKGGPGHLLRKFRDDGVW